MDQLLVQYYNAFVTALGYDPKFFQLYQGVGILADSNQAVWNVYDAIPPKSINHLYNPSQSNNFSQNYGSLVNQANANESTVISDAAVKYSSANGDSGYQILRSRILSALDEGGRSTSISVQYTIDEQQTTGSFAQDNISKGVNFFSDDPSHQTLSNKLTSRNIWIKGQVQKYISIPGFPMEFDNPVAAYGKPWYSQDAMVLAYKNTNPKIWNDKVTWNGFFGINGNMQRFCTQIVVADGVHFEVDSSASFSKEEQTSLTQMVKKHGAFPFYLPVSGAHNDPQINFKTTGELAYSINIPPGNPCIVGVQVYTAEEYLKLRHSL